jgi:mannose-6-phosphate isomerase-like protein (cupin superfamily)
MEEVYYVVSGEGSMVVGDDEYPIKTGDALYVPPGEFHTTIQKGDLSRWSPNYSPIKTTVRSTKISTPFTRISIRLCRK